MNLDQIIATKIGELTIANVKQAILIEALKVELAKRDETMARMQGEMAVLKVRASEPELPIAANRTNGHADAAH